MLKTIIIPLFMFIASPLSSAEIQTRSHQKIDLTLENSMPPNKAPVFTNIYNDILDAEPVVKAQKEFKRGFIPIRNQDCRYNRIAFHGHTTKVLRDRAAGEAGISYYLNQNLKVDTGPACYQDMEHNSQWGWSARVGFEIPFFHH